MKNIIYLLCILFILFSPPFPSFEKFPHQHGIYNFDRSYHLSSLNYSYIISIMPHIIAPFSVLNHPLKAYIYQAQMIRLLGMSLWLIKVRNAYSEQLCAFAPLSATARLSAGLLKAQGLKSVKVQLLEQVGFQAFWVMKKST